MDFQTARNQFLNDCLENGETTHSVKICGSILDKFAQWCGDNEMPKLDQLHYSPQALERRSERKVVGLTDEEIRKIMEASNQQERALVCLLLDTDIRLQELGNVRWGDVNIDAHVLHISQGKGREANFSSSTANELTRYGETMQWANTNDLLFRSQRRDFRVMDLRVMIHRISKRSGVKFDASRLRKTV